MAEQTISPKNKKMIVSTGPVGQNATVSSRIFDAFNYIFLTLVALTTIFPFIYIIGASFATEYEIATRPMFIIPRDVTVNAYRFIFSSNKILQGFGNSIFITACGTAINLFFTVTMAYAISKPRLRGRNFFLNMVIFSMFFSGGMIPGYIVVANILNLKNTYWSVLLPGAISAYNMMIVKNFFQGIPQELEESAAIDGCTDIGVLLRIVLPLSLPVLATFGLFYAVGHWNAYFGAMIYMTGAKQKWPLQVLLRELIIMSNGSAGDMNNLDPEFVQPPRAVHQNGGHRRLHCAHHVRVPLPAEVFREGRYGGSAERIITNLYPTAIGGKK